MAAIVTIDLDRLREVARVGVRRASSFMALGLRVAADSAVTSVQLDSNFTRQFMPDPLTAEQSANVRAEFGKWVIANSLRELEQHFAAFADRIYPVLLVMASGGKVPADIVQKKRTMHDDTNLGKKLLRLEQEFGIAASSGTHIASMSRARNALTHNLGRVAKRHCNDGSTLKLSWRGMDMVVGDKVFSGKFDPVLVETGTPVQIRVSKRERILQIGEAVDFSAHDLSEICLMFHVQADGIHAGVVKYATEKGIGIAKSKASSDESVASDL